MLSKTKLGLLVLVFSLNVAAWASEVAVLRNGFTIRHERRALSGANTRLYLGGDDTSFVDVPTAEIDRIEPDLTPPPEAPAPAAVVSQPASRPAAAVNIPEAVSAASDRYRLDPDLVNSVIRAESGFNPHAVSPKGAQGLMQLMPKTAFKLGVPNAFDPTANVEGGTRYLRELLERYNFDIIKALAAYNAGPHRVEQFGGVPPYRETRKYVAGIVRDFNRKKIAQQKAAKTAPKKPSAQAATTPKHAALPTGN
jgi:soluble lytic murein transglycosylase-like protein